MASRKEQKAEAKAEREAAMAAADAQARRQRTGRLIAVGIGLAALVVVLLIVISQSGDKGGDASNVQGAQAVETSLRGIPQSGVTLGKSGGGVEIIEFGDLQCPACKTFADSELDTIVDDLVKPGDAKLTFRNLTIIGPDSDKAAKAALAASVQDRYWEYIELFYRNQGTENSGYVTDEFLESVAKAAGVSDIDKWNKDRDDARWDQVLAKDDQEAQRLGFNSTPSFQVKGPNGQTAVPGAPTAQAISRAVQQVQ